MTELPRVDGVRLLRHPGDQNHTDATLTFAVGARDETLPTAGIAHALEHLVMGTARQVPIEMQAEVDLETTSFTASGSPARVGEFLTRICAALAAPPVDRLTVEAGVLAAEDGAVTHPLAALLLHTRYGATGPGVAWLEGAGYDGLTADQVVAFARRWFVRDNALLQVTGPVPEGLGLPLPDGSVPARVRTAGRLLDGPSVLSDEFPGVGVLLRLPTGDGARVADRAGEVLHRRIEEQCRHADGHSYVVDFVSVGAVDGTFDWVVLADAREGTEAKVARSVALALTELAEHGPTGEELAQVVARVVETDTVRDGELQRTYAAAMRELLREPPTEPLDLARTCAVRPDEIAAVLRAALPTAIAYAPEEAAAEFEAFGFRPEAGCATRADLPPGRLFKPPLGARAFIKEARSMRLVLTAVGLALQDEDGVHEIRWDEVAGVMRTDGPVVVFGRNGCVIPVSAEMFRGAGKALEQLTARTDPALWFDESAFSAEADE